VRFSSFVREYVAGLSERDLGFVSEIDPADEMFAYGLHSLHGSADAAAVLYFATGKSIADAVGAALAAAKQTDFEPALVGNQPVPVRYQIPYRFRVRG